MDEKTIPLSRYLDQAKSAREQPVHHWGDNVHYRALFEQMDEAVFIIGMDFHYMAANQQALDLLGYAESELIGMSVSEVMFLDETLANVGEVVIEDRSRLYERILKRKDGTFLNVEISTSIVNEEQGIPAYIQSIVRDISERKRAEEILRRHTLILSVISEASAQLMRTSNIESKIPGILALLGQAIGVGCCVVFEVDAFAAGNPLNIRFQWNKEPVPPLAKVLASMKMDLTVSAFGQFSFVDRDVYPDVPFCSFAIVPLQGFMGSRLFLGFFEFEKKISWLPSDQDVIQTAAGLIDAALQRNWYEETIRLNEARNRILIDAFPDLLIRIDRQGVILDYGASPNHPLFIHRDVIVGKKLSETWPPETVENIVGPKNIQGFVTPHRLDGFRLPYSNSTYEARLHPIRPEEALIVVRDITEQARLDEMKSDFINRASHELRTPLTSAILMTELIQGGGTLDELNDYWHTLTSELNRQKILIDRLLIAGRLESGMMRLDRVPTELYSILIESIRALKPIAGKRKVSVELSKGEPVTILGDKSGLEQVFINLINNAIKFSPEGTAVNISVDSDSTNNVSVYISDHGLGMPPEAIPHLFERFYRAKNVTIAEIPGSGIGLYIVKSIIDELGGGIHVQSAPNAGTTFQVTLKRA